MNCDMDSALQRCLRKKLLGLAVRARVAGCQPAVFVAALTMAD